MPNVSAGHLCKYSSVVKDKRKSRVQDVVALLDQSGTTINDTKTQKLSAGLLKKEKPVLNNASQGYMVNLKEM